MIGFTLPSVRRLLVFGAYSDDVKNRRGGALLHLLDQGTPVEVGWVSFAANADRKVETGRAVTASGLS